MANSAKFLIAGSVLLTREIRREIPSIHALVGEGRKRVLCFVLRIDCREMSENLLAIAEKLSLSPTQMRLRREEVRRQVLSASSSIQQDNFQSLHQHDLTELFSVYDHVFSTIILGSNSRRASMDCPFDFLLE